MKRNPSLFYLATMFFIVLAMLVALTGCNAKQIAALEEERIKLKAEAETTAAEIQALNNALARAKELGDIELAKVLDASKTLEQEHAKKLAKQRSNNAKLIEAAKEPNQAILEGIDATTPFVPAPWGELLRVAAYALLGGAGVGEVARRRGNRKVQKVGETLEMSGAVSFKHPQQGMQAAGQMGSHINAHLSIGRDKAKARIAEVVAARGAIDKISFGPDDDDKE